MFHTFFGKLMKNKGKEGEKERERERRIKSVIRQCVVIPTIVHARENNILFSRDLIRRIKLLINIPYII